ncbi:MAG: CBS domain-containing protein [Campylobacterota bacterium]|nr:CBS domain-containing protein [Campylobacterota bacterium]
MFLKDFIQQTNDTVTNQATLQEVIDKMSNDRLHHVVIIEDNKPIGMITERDVVRFFSKKIDFNALAITHATIDIITLHHTRMVQYALSMMLSNNIRKILVINQEDNYLGCVEQEDLIYSLEEKIHEKDLKLHELTNSGNKAVLINENSTLKYALDMMTANKLTSLLVTQDEKAVGIISESDIIKLAQKNINQNELIKYFMHAPIIQIEEYKTAEDMISLMHKNKVRKVVVYNTRDDYYCTLSSKDIASIIRGNYTKLLETKFVDTRDTFNALSEYVIELIDIGQEQVIFWTNSTTKANFNIRLDDNITKLISKDVWEKLFDKLLSTYILYETIEIQGRYYQIKGHYGTMTDDKIIKLFLNDVTKIMELTKQLEKENSLKDKLLYDQAKMVQMGEMIGNIAHQWRQPLSVITTTASGISVQKEYDMFKEDELVGKMNHIVDNANYLSDTIDTFRNFLKEKKEFKELILQDSIKKAFLLTNATLKNYQIKIYDNIDYSKDTKISMVVGELEQVIINIVNNAKDILVENNIDNRWIKIDLQEDVDNIKVSIEDNGGGIPDVVLPNIFNEYYTTKTKTHGTGLGLYMSSKIVKESLGGKLNVENTKNGAKFTITLPLA